MPQPQEISFRTQICSGSRITFQPRGWALVLLLRIRVQNYRKDGQRFSHRLFRSSPHKCQVGTERSSNNFLTLDGCFRMSVTSPRPEWRSMELSELGKLAENPFTWQPSSLALFRTELLTAVIKFVLGKSRDLYLLHYDLFQPKFGWRMHRQKHSLEAYIRQWVLKS